MLDMMKGYLQLAAGLGEMSRRKAMDAARDLLENGPAAGLRPGVGTGAETMAAQVSALADEIVTVGRQNRRLLVQLVRTETQAVLASLGSTSVAGRGSAEAGARLEAQLRALHARVDDLEQQLRQRAHTMPAHVVPDATPRHAATRKAATGKTATVKAATRKAATGKTATVKAATRKTATGKAAAPRTRTAPTSTSGRGVRRRPVGEGDTP